MPSHYLNQWCNIVDSTLGNKLQWNINRISNILIQENAFECVVCKMATILSQPRCVNTLRPGQNGRHFADSIISVVPNRWRAIILLTNDGLGCRCIYALLSLDELRLYSQVKGSCVNDLTSIFPEYSRITRWLPWLLMPWLHRSPRHQQSWHSFCRINRSLSSTKTQVLVFNKDRFQLLM